LYTEEDSIRLKEEDDISFATLHSGNVSRRKAEEYLNARILSDER
jgi:hypothetical protein